MKKLFVEKSNIDGKGIFTMEDIKKGEKIQYIIGTKKRLRSTTQKEALSIPNWYGVSRYVWIDPGESIFRYLNHSCRPNAGIIGTKTLVAMRPIKKGTEVVIDYSMTDGDVLWELSCTCKSPGCRKKIRSIQSIPSRVYRKHLPYITKYFQQLYTRAHTKKQKEGRMK